MTLQLRRFVIRYTCYTIFLMSMQCVQVIIMVFGSKDSTYFTYEGPDGFKVLRYVRSIERQSIQGYIILDHITFYCLVACTLLEPVFIRRAIRLKDKLLCKKPSIRASRRFTLLANDPMPSTCKFDRA